MIRKLRIRMTLLVILTLALISAGIVFSINAVNQRNIDRNAQASLQVLYQNESQRRNVQVIRARNAENAGEQDDTAGQEQTGVPFVRENPRRNDQEPPYSRPAWPMLGGISRENRAALSTYYSIILDENGQAVRITGNRPDLFDEESVLAVALAAQSSGREFGKLGSWYYLRDTADTDSALTLILDATLEQENARQVLYITAVVALAAWVLLSAGALFLIRRMIRPVAEAFDKQKQFVWDASHELKTPMAVISAHAELLKKENGDSESLGYILSEVERADTLVKNLLSLARMDQGTSEKPFAEFDLSSALLSVILPFESTVFEAGKTLETEIPDGITMTGQEDMIQQLMVILLSNALKYSSDGGLIRVTLAQKGKSRVLTVFNTGEGIAPEHREQVFDRFYREDLSHNSAVEGSGLGLSIAKAIVERHKGTITAGGVWHENAVFTVTL